MTEFLTGKKTNTFKISLQNYDNDVGLFLKWSTIEFRSNVLSETKYCASSFQDLRVTLSNPGIDLDNIGHRKFSNF